MNSDKTPSTDPAHKATENLAHTPAKQAPDHGASQTATPMSDPLAKAPETAEKA